MFEQLDFAPGWKTKVTAILGAVFNILSITGVVEVDAEATAQINAGLIALVGLFLAMKIDRKGES